MDWLAVKTGSFLNSSAAVLDQVVQSGSRFESTLSPAAMRVVKGVMGNDVLSAGFFLMIVGSFYTFFKDLVIQYYYQVISWFYVSVEVQEGDDCYKWLSEWVAERPLTKSVRHLTVKAVWDDNDDDQGYYRNNDSRINERPRLLFLPGMGSHVLYHKGYKVNVSRDRPENASNADSEQSRILASIQKKQSITISCIGWDMSLLKMIVQDAMEESYKKKEGKTTIYTSQPYDSYWSSSATRSPRAFHSVILAEGLKEELLTDITMFRNSAQWYHDRGVPYRRGYLLHGPPGTGKTSFIVALAGHLRMSVCIVNLGISGLNDQQLDQLLNNAPRNSILLMEDVDAALIKRKAGKAQSGSNNVTLSGILNALDGITAQEGSVVFMTTNHIRKLAPALIRPGRCDRKMLFDYADKHQIKGMFLKFFLSRSSTGQAKNEPASLKTSKKIPAAISALDNDPKEQARKEAHDEMIRRVADEICEKITFEDSVTTAQLQGFFMLHRDDPENIVEKVPEFLKELAHEREVLLGKKQERRERRAKKKAKKEAQAKKAKEEKLAAGGTAESSESEDEDEDSDVDSDTDSDSDSENYEKIIAGGSDIVGTKVSNGTVKKETKTEEAETTTAAAAAAV